MCLGDLIGKGANPELAVEIIKKSCEIVLKGNCGYLICETNNSYAFEWNSKRLKDSQLEYLRELPLYFEFYMMVTDKDSKQLQRLLRYCLLK